MRTGFKDTHRDLSILYSRLVIVVYIIFAFVMSIICREIVNTFLSVARPTSQLRQLIKSRKKSLPKTQFPLKVLIVEGNKQTRSSCRKTVSVYGAQQRFDMPVPFIVIMIKK